MESGRGCDFSALCQEWELDAKVEEKREERKEDRLSSGLKSYIVAAEAMLVND